MHEYDGTVTGVRQARDAPDLVVPVPRRKAMGALALGVLASGAMVGCSVEAGELAPTDSGRQNQGSAELGPESYDVRRSGAVCDGVTDDTKAWAHAVATVADAGGGLITWTGTSIVSQIELAHKVGLIGLGPAVSVIKQKAGRADGQHLILLVHPDARNVSLRDFAVDGNSEAQTGSAAGIYFDNSAGGPKGSTRHLILNVHVRHVAGTGIFWGYRMRSSLVDNVNIYKCDGYGFHGKVFSDNTMQNVDVGQSGLHGIYLVNCFNNKLSNIKSWYSGRIEHGSAGIYQRNGATNVYSNILAQENSGTGMVMYGVDSPITAVTVHGLNSDSDNSQGSSSNFGLMLNNVRHSIFDLTVSSQAPLAARPFAGVAVTNSAENKIVANVDPSVVTWKLAGNSIGDNDIDLCRGTAVSTPSDGTVAVSVYQHSEQRVTLIGDATVDNPSTPDGQSPIGLRYKFVFRQDDSGGHALTWSSAYKLPASLDIDTTPGTRTVVEFECAGDGDWIMTRFTSGIPA